VMRQKKSNWHGCLMMEVNNPSSDWEVGMKLTGG